MKTANHIMRSGGVVLMNRPYHDCVLAPSKRTHNMSLEPNRRDIERHIGLLTEPWVQLGLNALMEIRCLNENGASRHLKFDPTDEGSMDDAITQAINLNDQGWNIYVCVNPIEQRHKGYADDDAIVGAFFQFADADTEEAAKAIRSFEAQPDFYVVTGTTPFERIHAYWQVECIEGMEKWKHGQKLLIAKFASDKNINNPSRIMRLAGSVSWPKQQKQQKKHIPELTKLEEVLIW